MTDGTGGIPAKSRAKARGGSGDVTLQAAALLLGRAAPDPVPLAVLQRPGQALLTDGTHTAEGERGTGLLFGDREEHIGLDAEARGAVLPEIGGSGMQGERSEIDIREPFDPQPLAPSFSIPASTGNRFIAEVLGRMEGVSETFEPDDEVAATK
jgi:hypothetical protein